MSAPDNDTLQRLLSERTDGTWRAVRDDDAVDACGGPEVWVVEATDGTPVAEVYDSDDAPDSDRLARADAELIALAPSLAAEVLRLRERVELAEGERDALRALRDGRLEAPTEAELDAAAREGGLWVGTRPYTRHLDSAQPAMSAILQASASHASALNYDWDRPATRWYYVAHDGRIDSQRRPCAWPSGAPASPRIPGCETVGPCAYCDDPERAR